jgi:hypothetical protein
MKQRVVAIAGTIPALLFIAGAGDAEPWSTARIARLPDSAFAVVETNADGRAHRHLPHHDESGGLDLPHLRAAISRLDQVQWRDPVNDRRARCHLERHAREAGLAWRSGVVCEAGE